MGVNFEEDSIGDFLDRLNYDIYIPYIQRDYQWEEDQILKLFDSVLKGFPIGTFLVWDVDGSNIPIVYEFPNNLIYKGRIAPDSVKSKGDTRPSSTDEFPSRKIKLVLDGQQRLTSLNIGLFGSLIKRKTGKSRRKEDSWETKRLYVNLMHRPEHGPNKEFDFDLEFKTEDEVFKTEEKYWYRLGKFLQSDRSKLWNEIVDDFSDEYRMAAKRTHRRVYTQLNSNSSINYYNYTENNINSMLEMFIRTNDGGKKLKNKDIVLSIITEYWNRNHDVIARDEISAFVEAVTLRNDKKLISESFVMRNLLYCSDNRIAFTLENFTEDVIEDIFNIWMDKKSYTQAYRSAFQFLKKYNLEPSDIGGKFSLHILIYYFYKTGIQQFENSDKNHLESKKNLIGFLCILKIKRLYTAATNAKLENIRNGMITEENIFDIQSINDNLKSLGVSLNVEKGFLADILKSASYKTSDVKAILTLMYKDNLNKIEKSNDLHIDHIYPKKILNVDNLDNKFCSEFESPIHTVCNLQYLTKNENKNKSNKQFEEWIDTRTDKYKETNNIPKNMNYSDITYENFIEARYKLIIKELLKSGE
jgi:uncharacterized protein with ParB-like and HNH nuclease domain